MATGTLQATVQVDVGSQVSGTVQKLYVDYNSQVKKDQVIAQIDPRTFQTQVLQNRASLESANAALKNAMSSVEQAKAEIANNRAALISAQANAEKAKSTLANDSTNYERFKQLRAQDLVSQSDLDNSKTTFEISKANNDSVKAQISSSQAQLESSIANERASETKIDSTKADISKAQANLDQAELNLTYCTIIAPLSGTVIVKNVQEGQTVASSFQTPTLFSIADDLTKMQCIASIDEADVGKVQTDQEVIFTVGAYPDKKFTGVVSQVRNQPINLQNVITYQGVVDVSNPNLELRPGMTASISFSVAHQDDVLKVPNAALRFKLQETSSTSTSTTARAARSGGGGGGGGGGQNRPPGQGGQGGGGRGSRPARGKVYILDSTGNPQSIDVKLGISDGSNTSVESDKLKEGQDVITGYQTAETAPTATASPFGPQRPGMGAPGMGGRGGGR